MISGSSSINHVPATNINGIHIINKILDNDHYEIILNEFIPQQSIVSNNNIITIKYPDIFQMFFNYNDTLGKIVGIS